MRKLLIIFLLLIQSFLVCVNAGEVSYSAPNLNKHIEYIYTQATPQKKFYVDFKNYENTVITLNSKVHGIFAQRNSNNINGFSEANINNYFNEKFSHDFLRQTYNSNFYLINLHLKNEISTRAP